MARFMSSSRAVRGWRAACVVCANFTLSLPFRVNIFMWRYEWNLNYFWISRLDSRIAYWNIAKGGGYEESSKSRLQAGGGLSWIFSVEHTLQLWRRNVTRARSESSTWNNSFYSRVRWMFSFATWTFDAWQHLIYHQDAETKGSESFNHMSWDFCKLSSVPEWLKCASLKTRTRMRRAFNYLFVLKERKTN